MATARRVLPAAVLGHDLVVVDLARQGGPLLAELVDRCDDLLVVTPATVPGLAAAARLVADLGRDGRAGLVLRPGGLSDADAERVTGLPVVAAVADQRGVAASVDRGLGPLAREGSARPGRPRPAGGRRMNTPVPDRRARRRTPPPGGVGG